MTNFRGVVRVQQQVMETYAFLLFNHFPTFVTFHSSPKAKFSLFSHYVFSILLTRFTSFFQQALKVSHLPEVCSRNNIENLRYEWADGSLPPEEEWNTEFKNLVLAVHKKLLEGEKIIVHCMGGLGRTGTFAVCLLQLMNPEMDPEDSLEHVRKYRKNACENNLQKSFVLDQFPDLLEKWK
eukprot:TRINITY_DN782_c0_g1_i10.p1 TRINITY_DN782_c0_g1~~TRINITY_DN782_c0_g1_i10.p1  ORF type:complete len:181 (-),score=22.57 TRINITY_DN782_c0_g1_i10:235-777(-)